jgi:dipeptidyl aminopeptidase/acylaminoacyl peptidase
LPEPVVPLNMNAKVAPPGEPPLPQRHIVRPLLYFLALLYLAGTIVGGIGLGEIAMHPHSPSVTAREEFIAREAAQKNSTEFRDVKVTTPDGAVLSAWFMRPHESNGNAVILLHGVSDNRLGMYGYGQWLVQNHYMVLLPDARAHGNSGAELAAYGLNEANDIHQWVDWIETAEHPRCMFGLGESMGAAQLLQALPKELRFCAVVAESPFATFREVAYARFGRPFHTGPWIGKTIFRPTIDVGFLYVRARYGLNMESASPQNAVANMKTPVLLIHGLDDTNIPPYHSELIRAKNPANVSVWKVPGAVHTGAHAAAPQEFERRVLEWFAYHSSATSMTGGSSTN